MARSPFRFTSGSLPATGSGQMNALYDVIETELTSYTSSFNGEQAWVEWYEHGSRDKTWRSIGDPSLGSGSLFKGDANIFIRRDVTSNDQSAGLHVDIDISGNASGSSPRPQWNTPPVGGEDAAAVNWYCLVNEYEFCFVYRQGGNTSFLYQGQPSRPIPAELSYVGRISSSISTTGTVTVSLDRPVIIGANAKLNQPMHLHTVTPSGSIIEEFHRELVTLTSASADGLSVELQGVDNTYISGSLLGLYPTTTVITAPQSALRYIVSIQAEGTIIPNNTGNRNRAEERIRGNLINYLSYRNNPRAFDGFYRGQKPAIVNVDSIGGVGPGQQHYVVGFPNCFIYIPQGDFSTGDILFQNLDQDLGYMYFDDVEPDATLSAGKEFRLAIGPGIPTGSFLP